MAAHVSSGLIFLKKKKRKKKKERKKREKIYVKQFRYSKMTL